MTNSRNAKGQNAMEKTEAVYSKTAIDHMRNPRNAGLITNPDGQARITGPCGDTMEIWLRVRDGIIEQATFWTDGCGTTIAAGSVVTELAKGKQAGEAFRIAQQDVLEALGGLPEESVHCALLAANTLKEAVKDYLACRNEPWKRAYRKC
jgi:nitrogen fixation protein NifU and related proteins